MEKKVSVKDMWRNRKRLDLKDWISSFFYPCRNGHDIDGWRVVSKGITGYSLATDILIHGYYVDRKCKKCGLIFYDKERPFNP